jgi:urease accessory protein
MPDCSHSQPPSSAPWRASLRLRFARDADGPTTRLVERSHRGPLRVQKALYPEGPGTCHAIMLHPPGGVVGGDELDIDVATGAGAHCLLTTPGAAKWYRANGKVSRQRVHLRVDAGAACEWLPQESIFYDGADVVLDHAVDLAAGARYVGIEILCFGRRASQERFTSGVLRQHTRIRLAGKLVWWEQGTIAPGPAMDGVFGLNGRTVCATLIAVGPPVSTALLATLRALDPLLAITQMKTVLVARYLGDDSETARHALVRVWQHLRPHLIGCAAPLPRIWHT